MWYGILLLEPQCKLNIRALNNNQNYLISVNTTDTWTSQKGDNCLSFFPSKFRGKWRLGEEGRGSSEFPSYNNPYRLTGDRVVVRLGRRKFEKLNSYFFYHLVCSFGSEENHFKGLKPLE